MTGLDLLKTELVVLPGCDTTGAPGWGMVGLQRAFLLAGVFFVTSLTLSILAGIDRKPQSILNTGAPVSEPGGLPPLGQGRGVLDQLQPPAPTAPQVPRSQ